ncbi:MAG: hypothetical protein ABIZ05_10160 [Pseudonocardiaceae bacterium]
MSAACRALSTWSAELVDFQRRAAAYERQAADAAASVSSARTAVAAIARPGANASPAEIDEASHQAARANGKLDAASDELSRVIAQAHGLLAEHGEMARRVANALRDAADVAPAEPGFFHRLGSLLSGALDFMGSLPGTVWGWVKDYAELIAQIGDILSDISTVLGVVATVCMFIPPLEAASGALFGVSALFALGALGDARPRQGGRGGRLLGDHRFGRRRCTHLGCRHSGNGGHEKRGCHVQGGPDLARGHRVRDWR